VAFVFPDGRYIATDRERIQAVSLIRMAELLAYNQGVGVS